MRRGSDPCRIRRAGARRSGRSRGRSRAPPARVPCPSPARSSTSTRCSRWAPVEISTPLKMQVVAVGEARVALVAHVVERPDVRGVVGDEHELVAELLLHVRGRSGARPRGRGRRRCGAPCSRARRRCACASASGMRGNGSVGTVTSTPNSGLDLGAVLLLDRGEAGDEQLLVQLHDVLVAVDPADLGVDRDELGRVAAGEARVGAERGRRPRRPCRSRRAAPSA